jgi:Cys-tRNA(Pro)/Cys-tRNA(Cys) deacylase
VVTDRRAARAGGTPATSALARAGVAHELRPYHHEAGAPSYGLEAATALGVAPEQVFKTLVAEVDERLVVAVVPVSGSLDLKALAAAAGGKRAEMADVAEAERSTGYVVGGISPLGQRRPLTTVVDETVAAFDRVLVSAGRRGLDVSLAPADLVHMTRAVLAPIGRPGAAATASPHGCR